MKIWCNIYDVCDVASFFSVALTETGKLAFYLRKNNGAEIEDKFSRREIFF